MIVNPTATHRAVSTGSSTWTVNGPSTVEVDEMLVAFVGSNLSQFTSSAGTPDFSDGFESGNFSNWGFSNTVGTTLSTVSGAAYTGSFGARVEATSTNSVAQFGTGTGKWAQTNRYGVITLRVKFSSLTDTTTNPILTFSNVLNNSANFEMWVTATGTIKFDLLSSNSLDTGINVALNTWYTIEVRVDYGSTTYSAEVVINGVHQGSVSSTGQTATSVRAASIGNSLTGRVYTMDVDDVKVWVSNTAMPAWPYYSSSAGGPTWPSGWTPLLSGQNTTSNSDQSVYVGYKWVGSTDVTTTGVSYSWTWGSQVPQGSVTFVRVPGADKTLAVDVAEFAASGASASSINIPTPYVGKYSTVLAFFHSHESDPVSGYWVSPSSPWSTALASTEGGDFTKSMVAYRDVEEGQLSSLSVSVASGQTDALAAIVVAIPIMEQSPPGLVWDSVRSHWRHPKYQYAYPDGSTKTRTKLWQSYSGSAWVPVTGPSRTVLGAKSAGSYMPGQWTTGPKRGTNLVRQNGDITVTTSGTTIQNLDLYGRIIVEASNVTIKNCIIRGTYAAPTSSATPLINARSASCVNLLVEDCEIAPMFPHWRWEGGISGHDFIARRCNIHSGIDGINVYNTFSPGTATNVTIDFCWIHDLSWWSSVGEGVVHPSDTVTHNDCIQHQGGSGTIIRGNRLDATYRRNFGHWWRASTTQPYSLVAIGSRPDSSPFQAVPDRGSGTEETGRYNLTDLSALMVNNNVGNSTSITFTDNWISGGYIPVNAGGAVRSSGSLGSFLRNRFSRSPGAQSSGGDNVYTISVDSTWVGFLTDGAGTSNKNVFDDNSAEVNVRYSG